ncbi:hypothetical protein DITRI_Ditri16bG0094400 [Diplodiscus trichospermus]
MASDQVSRRENTTTEREIYIEKERVPKMTNRFESLVEKARDSDVAGAKQNPHEKNGNTAGHAFGVDQNARDRHEFESLAGKVGDMNVSAVIVTESDEARKEREKQVRGKIEASGEKQRGSSSERGGRDESHKETSDKGAEFVGSDEGGNKPEQLSLQEISKLRASAQQNSAETIRAAEERYNKAKESAKQGLNTVGEHAKEKDAEAKDTDIQGAQHNILEDTKGSETNDNAAEKIQHGYAATKDTLVSAGKTTLDYTVPKAEQAKDYALEKAVKAKDTAFNVTKNIANYAEEKAVATKDVTIEKGKEAAELAGKVAVDVKDKAVATSWSAAHYTTEKAVEGTKVAARAVEGVAEYAGHKAAEIAAKPLGAAKEAAAAAGESMKEYTARKKEEAERELVAKRSTETQETEESSQEKENKEQESLVGEAKNQMKGVARTVQSATEKTLGGLTVEEEEEKEEEEESETGVLGAIGETIVEIAQTTKELVIGPSPDQPNTESGDGYRQ